MNNRTCVSGGAPGADYLWCEMASKQPGISIEIMSFLDHDVQIPPGLEHCRKILTPELLAEANEKLEKPAEMMQRTNYRLPEEDQYDRQLLQRNWWIAKDADAVFAITRFESSPKSLGIIGGTAWACEMFWNESQKLDTDVIPLFAYDMLQNPGWYQSKKDGTWIKCEQPKVNNYKRIGLVGAVELTDDGRQALLNCFE